MKSAHASAQRRWLEADVSTPALQLDRSVLEDSLDEMSALAHKCGVGLFPPAKTHRMTEIGLLQIAHGSDGLSVAKLGEAAIFAAVGIARIFVAYPIVGEDKASRNTVQLE